MSRKKALFIDNDFQFIEQWAKIIERAGVEVIKNSEGSSAVILAKTYKPDLIIVGLELKDMNGYLVCKHLREDATTKSIPLFITSATATEKDFDKHKKLRVRADEYFLKPVDEMVFMKKLSKVLGIKIEPEEKMAPIKTSRAHVDETELLLLKEKLRTTEMELELVKKDLKDTQESHKELSISLTKQLETEKKRTNTLAQENETLTEQIKILKEERLNLSQMVDKLEKELEKKNHQVKETISNYEDRNRELEKQLRTAEGKLEKSLKTIEELKSAAAETERHKTEITEFRKEVVRLKERIVQLEEVLKEKDAELTQMDSISERSKELEEEVASLTNQKEMLEMKITELLSESKTELTTLMDQLNNLSEEKAKIANELNQSRENIRFLQDKLNENDSLIQNYLSEKISIEESLKEKEKAIEEKERSIHELLQRSNELSNIIGEKDRIIRDNALKITELEKRLESSVDNEELFALKNRLSEMEKQLAEKEEALLKFSGIEDRVTELERELGISRAREEELKKRVNELEELRKKDEEFLNTLDMVVQEKDELSRRLKELEEGEKQSENLRILEMQSELLTLRSQLTEKEEEIKNLKELVDLQMEEKATLEKRLQDLQSKQATPLEEKKRKVEEEAVIELTDSQTEDVSINEKESEELLIHEEKTAVQPEITMEEKQQEETDLVSMLENIWQDSVPESVGVKAEKPDEAFFTEEIATSTERNQTIDQESMEYKKIIDSFNSIYSFAFQKLLPENRTEQSLAIWGEFISEQDEKEKKIFEGVTINPDCTLPTDKIIKNLKDLTERESMGKIAGLNNLYLNQKLKSKLTEFLDFMVVIVKRRLPPSEANSLIKDIKEKQMAIK